MCDVLNVEGGGKYPKMYHDYHLSRKTSYNRHVSDLIGTDSSHNCFAWWYEVFHCFVTLSMWLELL